MHTILGAGGPVSNSLTQKLLDNGHTVRLVSRRPVSRFPGIDWKQVDLKDSKALMEAVKGSSVIYLCAGLKYDKKVWGQEWPLIMQNLINAGKSTGARVIFFDNVYMYGHVRGPMTENTPYNPSSVKGEIRARIARQLMDEAVAGNIKASIARAADFYGAESLNSFYDSMVLAKYAKGEKAMWLGNINRLHSFTYIPDAGNAMYLLGQNPSSDTQIWHLPTATAMTGDAFIKLAADTFGCKPKFMTINKFMLKSIGLFNHLIGETAELYYQYQYDYIFDSSKFEQAFNVHSTPYAEGMKTLSATLFKVR